MDKILEATGGKGGNVYSIAGAEKTVLLDNNVKSSSEAYPTSSLHLPTEGANENRKIVQAYRTKINRDFLKKNKLSDR